MNKTEKKMVEKIEMDIRYWLNPNSYEMHIKKEKRLKWLERDYREIQGEITMLLWFMVDKKNFEGSEDEEFYKYLNNKAYDEYSDTKRYIEENF